MRKIILREPIEAAELGPDGEAVTAMIDFTAGDEITVERQQVTGEGVTETVFSAMRLPCGLHGTGADGGDEWLGPFRYMTVNLATPGRQASWSVHQVTARMMLAAGVLTVLASAGCGSGVDAFAPPPTHSAPAAPASAPLPANPVTVLKMTGAVPDPGEKYGTMGVENDQVAHGTFPGGENVWVFTYDTAAHRAYWVAHPMSGPADGETKVLGPDLSLIILDAVSLARAGGLTAAQVAAKVGGTVLPR